MSYVHVASETYVGGGTFEEGVEGVGKDQPGGIYGS